MTPPGYTLPIPDNTVLSLMDWVFSLEIPVASKMIMMCIIRHVDWKTGRRCHAGIDRVTEMTGLSRKSVTKHL